MSHLNSSLGGLSFTIVDGEPYVKVGADTPRPFKSGYNLVLSETAFNQDYITVTVPDDIDEGMFVSVCSAGSNFKVIHDITGDGIESSEVLFENRIRLANGVTTCVRVLKCKFLSGKTINSGWDDSDPSYTSHFVFIFG